MNKKTDKNLIVGLDIGTSKVVAIVGEVGEASRISAGLASLAVEIASSPDWASSSS